MWIDQANMDLSSALCFPPSLVGLVSRGWGGLITFFTVLLSLPPPSAPSPSVALSFVIHSFRRGRHE